MTDPGCSECAVCGRPRNSDWLTRVEGECGAPPLDYPIAAKSDLRVWCYRLGYERARQELERARAAHLENALLLASARRELGEWAEAVRAVDTFIDFGMPAEPGDNEWIAPAEPADMNAAMLRLYNMLKHYDAAAPSKPEKEG